MPQPFFSIIIPVYKVEQYIHQCVDSVLSQSFQDYELILVDDGSPDNCPKICDDYKKKDYRVKIIHKKNGGSSSARNAGIKIATGKYLMFLDSDDYWETSNDLYNLFSRIKKSNDAQVIVFAAKLLYPNGKIVDDSFCFENKYFSSGEESLYYLISRNLIIGSACTKTIRRDFFIQNNLFFVEGLKSEDIEWILRLCALLPSYYYYNKHFYIYRQMRDGSNSNTVDSNHLNQYLGIITNFCSSTQIDKEVKEMLYNYVAYHLSLICAFAYNLDNKSEKKSFIRQIKELSWLFDYKLMPRMRMINLFYHVLGFRLTVVFLGLYLKLR